MKIFCPVWGEQHIGLLESALGRSLSWPKNKASVHGAEWIITCASAAEAGRIRSIIKKISESFRIREYIVDGLDAPGIDTGRVLIETLRGAIQFCLIDKEPMLMATPDFIYGEGTIEAFKIIAGEYGSCATIAHMRVLPTILTELSGFGPSNNLLMSIAWRHPHISWYNSDAERSPSILYQGGVKWHKISQNIKAVQHYMPSPFFVNFIAKDIEHFQEFDENRPPGFGMWDHIWPAHLLKQGRLRFIGSSEAAMMIEVTDAYKNVPPENLPHQDGFFRKHFHNDIQKQFISIFKGV